MGRLGTAPPHVWGAHDKKPKVLQLQLGAPCEAACRLWAGSAQTKAVRVFWVLQENANHCDTDEQAAWS